MVLGRISLQTLWSLNYGSNGISLLESVWLLLSIQSFLTWVRGCV